MVRRYKDLITSPPGILILVFCLILLVHIFIFRGILAQAGDISSNNASITRDELVPFFNFQSSYLPEGASELSGSDEFRVAYSFWSSWVRYNPILPYTLVIVNTISAFLLFLAFIILAKYFSKNKFSVILISLGVALLIHLLLMYAKVAHFYSLILGFSMFALSTSLLIEQLYFTKKIQAKKALLITGLVLCNPAVHFHILFYLLSAILFLNKFVIDLIVKQYNKKVFFRNLLSIAAIFIFSIVPYVAYIYFSTPSTKDVFSQAPVNYWSIFYSSVPFLHVLSLDTLGHIDLFRHGDYLSSAARIATAVVLLVVCIHIVLHRKKIATNEHLLISCFVICLISIWMSVGYSTDSFFSFHKILSDFMLFTANYNNIFIDILNQLVSIFISVLRYPHRFQFILYYTIGLLFTISMIWAYNRFNGKINKYVLSIFTLVFIFSPLIISSDYRATYITGNFDGFLEPYKIPNDLKNIKSILAAEDKKGRTFILPSLESGRKINDTKDGHTFIDKYLIYYLDHPTVYTGFGAGVKNKIVGYSAYRSIAFEEKWWQDILIKNLGVTSIVIPNNLAARYPDAEYLRGIEPKINESLSKSTSFKERYKGRDYTLYTTDKKADDTDTLIDMSWYNFLKIANTQTLPSSRLYFPVQISDFVKKENTQLLTDDIESSFYDLYSMQRNRISMPTSNLLPFNKNLVASSNYTANMFSMATLYDKQDRYNYMEEVVPSLLNLKTTQYIGIIKNTDARVSYALNASESNKHRILLKAASKEDTIEAVTESGKIKLNKVAGSALKPDYMDFSYYYTDVDLKKGKNTLTIPSSKNSVLVEHATLIPLSEIPTNATQGINKLGIEIYPTSQDLLYNVKIDRSKY